MKKKKLKEEFTLIIFSVIIMAIMYGCIWYANMHDSKCEATLYLEENYGCYERFLEKEKENNKDNK